MRRSVRQERRVAMALLADDKVELAKLYGGRVYWGGLVHSAYWTRWLDDGVCDVEVFCTAGLDLSQLSLDLLTLIEARVPVTCASCKKRGEPWVMYDDEAPQPWPIQGPSRWRAKYRERIGALLPHGMKGLNSVPGTKSVLAARAALQAVRWRRSLAVPPWRRK